MTEDEVNKRIDRLEDTLDTRLARLEAAIESTKGTMITMTEKLSLAPGTAFACQAHTAKLTDLDLRLGAMERKFWVGAGGLAVLTFLLSMFGPAIRALFKIAP